MRETIGLKLEPLLPTYNRADRPLFFVMMIMVFLACLAAIGTHASYRAAGNWGNDLKHSASVQVKVERNEDGAVAAKRAAIILEQNDAVLDASPISEAQARAMLRPWLGNIDLPENLPVPFLIDLTLSPDVPFDMPALKQELSRAGLEANIDDHGRWSRDIARTARAVQLIAVTSLILLICAAIATAGFATQSGLNARRTIIDVLSQVGAKDKYIARLFTSRFAWLGLKAGVSGALLAGLIAVLFWLASGGERSPLVPGFAIDFFDLLLLVFAPFIAAIVCALSARYTVLSTLKKEALR